jgi:hypothetical protein
MIFQNRKFLKESDFPLSMERTKELVDEAKEEIL